MGIDTALLFEQAEYYSLQEACDYLNRKHKLDNITPKKLLKRISDFEINCFVFGKGFSFRGDFSLSSEFDYLDFLEKEEMTAYEQYIYNYFFMCEAMPSMHCKSTGIFLKIDNRCLSNILLANRIELHSDGAVIDGFIPYNNFDSDPYDIDVFLWDSQKIQNFKQDKFDFSNVKIQNSQFFPVLSLDEIEELGLQKALEQVNLNIIEYKPIEDWRIEANDASYFNREGTILLNLEVTINDLVILHKDLEKLERNILEKAPIPRKETIEIKHNPSIKARQGVSKNKVLAKAVAVQIARHEWDKDHKQEIKTNEMLNIIWERLIDIGLEKQLPQEVGSLLNWIANDDVDVRPEHAKQGGAPKTK